MTTDLEPVRSTHKKMTTPMANTDNFKPKCQNPNINTTPYILGVTYINL